MKNVNIKWLSIGVLAYIGSAILVSSVFIMGLMLMFNTIPPEQLQVVEPTATIIRVGESLIGFAIALSISVLVVKKTCASKPHTIWAFAFFLTLYAVLSIALHPGVPIVSSLMKLIAPWVIALLAVKWKSEPAHVPAEKV